MPSYGSRLLYPVDGQASETSMGDEFRTRITETDGSETRDSRWSLPRRIINIGGEKFSSQQRRVLRGFHRAIAGAGEPFLFRRGNDDEYELQNELIGVGNGVQSSFQCRIFDNVENRTSSIIVNYLDHDYPPTGLDAYGKFNRPTRYIAVMVNGVIKTLDTHYTVNRETGIITFLAGSIPGAGQQVRVSGGFYVLVRCTQDALLLKPLGAGWYEAEENARFIEPKGGR